MSEYRPKNAARALDQNVRDYLSPNALARRENDRDDALRGRAEVLVLERMFRRRPRLSAGR